MTKAKIRKVSDNFDDWIRKTSAQSNLDGVELTRILGMRLQGVDVEEELSNGKKVRKLKRKQRNLIDEFFRDDLL